MTQKKATMEAVERSGPLRSRSSSSGAGDFFICFTARPSSSSATSSASAAKRVPSKALMSPGRGPSSAPALSASLSRRLRNSGSVKGGQSPMFPSGLPLAGRKKGCAFEAAEPSSPKVTCIGQVRVKAKNKVKSSSMVRSRSQGGRECCPGSNQSWVYQLPLCICEALRSFGSEFNCFVPCGGRAEKGKEMGEGRMVQTASTSSCGAVVAKWLLTVQESEEEVKGGEKVEVGFFVREEEEKGRIEELDEIGVEKGEMLLVGENGEGGEEKMSVCIPPRNALLLMRCRSDPVKMAALANRFWGSPVTKQHSDAEQVEEEVELEEEMEKHKDFEKPFAVKKDVVEVSEVGGESFEEESACKKTTGTENTLMEETQQQVEEEEELCVPKKDLPCCSPLSLQANNAIGEEKELSNQEKKGVIFLPEKEEEKNDGRRLIEERRHGTTIASRSKEKGRRRAKEKDTGRHSFSSELDARRNSFSSEREARRASFSICRGRWSFSLEKANLEASTHVKSLPFSSAETYKEENEKKEAIPEEELAVENVSEKLTSLERHESAAEVEEEEEGEEGEEVKEKKGESGEWTELPDCLLMMMYEPKLSMEVSKETWVCGNDFLRWPLHHSRNRVRLKQADDSAAILPPEEKEPESIAPAVADDPLPEPPRSASTQQLKLSVRQAAVAPYEPLVLTRCKSEPVRSSAKLAPDACFWKDRHRPIGAAGIGF